MPERPSKAAKCWNKKKTYHKQDYIRSKSSDTKNEAQESHDAQEERERSLKFGILEAGLWGSNGIT
jgi:hypothetical protein